MRRFFLAWLTRKTRYQRGKRLEIAVRRVGGNLELVDSALYSMGKIQSPPRLSVRHFPASDVYGLFLPCLIRQRK
jgi:hypothetical protein